MQQENLVSILLPILGYYKQIHINVYLTKKKLIWKLRTLSLL